MWNAHSVVHAKRFLKRWLTWWGSKICPRCARLGRCPPGSGTTSWPFGGTGSPRVRPRGTTARSWPAHGGCAVSGLDFSPRHAWPRTDWQKKWTLPAFPWRLRPGSARQSHGRPERNSDHVSSTCAPPCNSLCGCACPTAQFFAGPRRKGLPARAPPLT